MNDSTIIEDYVLQNGNYCFNGKLIKENDTIRRILGACYAIENENEKRYIGNLTIDYVRGERLTRTIVPDMNDYINVALLAQEIINALNGE